MGWLDRTIGIILGVLLGVGVVVAFVFVFSQQTVDAPSLSGVQTVVPPRTHRSGGSQSAPQRPHPAHHHAPQPTPPPATVRVIGGAPPTGGPPALHYRQGARAQLNVVSDSTVAVRVTGYGVATTVPAGQATTIGFTASRRGTFALIAAGSHIDLARITVGGPSP